jgi:hypothetical protein
MCYRFEKNIEYQYIAHLFYAYDVVIIRSIGHFCVILGHDVKNVSDLCKSLSVEKRSTKMNVI